MTQTTTSQAGMTLVEILVATALSGLLIAAIYSLFQVHHRMAIKQEETTLMQQELLAATVQISEELRMCGYSPNGTESFGFAHKPGIGSPDYGRGTNATSVYCSLDWNGDGLTNESGSGSLREHVGYRLNIMDSGALKKKPDNVLRKYDTGAVHWQPLFTNIGDLRFTYFNAKAEAIDDPETNTGAIRMVELRITAVPSAGREHLGIGNRTMTTRVWCRNLAR